MHSTKIYETGVNVMTPTELTRQDSGFYDNIRSQRYKMPKHSNQGKRLHSAGLRAFYNYKRHMEAEQSQDCMLEVFRWGF